MDAVALARAYVTARHPDAAVAVLGGSIVAGTGTATSDLDIALLYDDPAVNYAETVEFEGTIVETFVHSREALDGWFAKERSTQRAVMYDIWANGIVLVDDGSANAVQEDARRTLAAGPDPLEPGDVDLLRYAVSSGLDDLRDRPDGGAETYAVTAELFERSSLLLLGVRRAWTGRGKWHIRRLQQLDDPIARDLVDWAAAGADPPSLVAIVERVLEAAGGYLQAPHLRGHRPDQTPDQTP
jgi:predicted nucleotidyltransferase